MPKIKKMVNFGVTGESADLSESQNLNFAKKQLEKHGWTEGKGLGRDESGRAYAVKVGVKNNKLGVGYDGGKEFTNNWWDHLFDKAASNIVVEESQNGVQLLKKDKKGDIATPKKLWKPNGIEMYYGRFVKASADDTFFPAPSQNPRAPRKFSDEELFHACGGRTAHKSARHGHKLSGKLKRVAEQDEATHCFKKPKVKRRKYSKEKRTHDEIGSNDAIAHCALIGKAKDTAPKEIGESKASDVEHKFCASRCSCKVLVEEHMELGNNLKHDSADPECKPFTKKEAKNKAKKKLKRLKKTRKVKIVKK